MLTLLLGAACGDASAQERGQRPLFGLKTNMLFDAATALNLEAEVPLGQRWSAAGEWVFPWWLHNSRQRALEAGLATVEARRWFGDRTGRRVMTGWFAGIYAGGGYFDIEWDTEGRQGELLHTGLSGGYAHTIINRTGDWRIEYSLGLGYMRSTYRYYEAETDFSGKWHLIRRNSGTYNWFGPTRAKISLIWMVPRGLFGRGGAR